MGWRCLVDAPMIIVFAYVAVMTQPDARARLEGRDLMIGGYLDHLFHAKVFGDVLDAQLKRLAMAPRFVDRLRDPAARRMYLTAAAREEEARADAEREAKALAER